MVAAAAASAGLPGKLSILDPAVLGLTLEVLIFNLLVTAAVRPKSCE
jgi:hypothetical protein